MEAVPSRRVLTDLGAECCPSCGNDQGITESQEQDTFRYGDSPPITVTVPVGHCGACGFHWTDHSGEDIKTAAIEKYLSE